MKKALVECTHFCCTEIMSTLMVNSRRSGGTPLVIPRVRVRVCVCASGTVCLAQREAFQLHLAVAGGYLHCPFRAYSALSIIYPRRGLQNLLRSLFLSIIFRFVSENNVFCFLPFSNYKFIPQLSRFELNSLNCLC